MKIQRLFNILFVSAIVAVSAALSPCAAAQSGFPTVGFGSNGNQNQINRLNYLIGQNQYRLTVIDNQIRYYENGIARIKASGYSVQYGGYYSAIDQLKGLRSATTATIATLTAQRNALSSGGTNRPVYRGRTPGYRY